MGTSPTQAWAVPLVSIAAILATSAVGFLIGRQATGVDDLGKLQGVLFAQFFEFVTVACAAGLVIGWSGGRRRHASLATLVIAAIGATMMGMEFPWPGLLEEGSTVLLVAILLAILVAIPVLIGALIGYAVRPADRPWGGYATRPRPGRHGEARRGAPSLHADPTPVHVVR